MVEVNACVTGALQEKQWLNLNGSVGKLVYRGDIWTSLTRLKMYPTLTEKLKKKKSSDIPTYTKKVNGMIPNNEQFHML